ncbi:MAG: NAD-dependent malic enzyme [Sandaracinaceae bacterium]
MRSYDYERDEHGHETVRIPYEGPALLASHMYNRGTAFTQPERQRLGLSGLLPNRVRKMDEQAVRAYGHVKARCETRLEQYVALADLESRNAHLYYRVLVDHLEELLPVVYTPTVGEACQKYSHLFRRGRGLWITPDHRGRIASVLRSAPFEGVRLICVTDNERILGLGDQGAGGMGIPVGKLDLYTVGAGIHPATTLPISFDVGTDNRELLDDPYYIGWHGERLRGEEYDTLVEEFVAAVQEVFPNALLQWEDFKKDNAFNLLDRYRERLLSFNDDIQGTAGVALAGVIAAAKVAGTPMESARILIVGAGAAGVGIGRILRAELSQLGVEGDALTQAIAVLDSRGLLAEGRAFRSPYKKEFAWPDELVQKVGLSPGGGDDLLECVQTLKPTVLIGTSGQPGTFTEDVVRAMAANVERPAIFPYSNPNSKTEATPEQLLNWTDGRALVATGSPFEPVEYEGKTYEIAQGNNVYIFPGVGLGALAAGATRIDDSFFTAAAHAVAGMLDRENIERGQLYPPLAQLRTISRAVACSVARHAVDVGAAPAKSYAALDRAVDAMMWEPRYPEIV